MCDSVIFFGLPRKGGSREPPRTPPAYGPASATIIVDTMKGLSLISELTSSIRLRFSELVTDLEAAITASTCCRQSREGFTSLTEYFLYYIMRSGPGLNDSCNKYWRGGCSY